MKKEIQQIAFGGTVGLPQRVAAQCFKSLAVMLLSDVRRVGKHQVKSARLPDGRERVVPNALAVCGGQCVACQRVNRVLVRRADAGLQQKQGRAQLQIGQRLGGNIACVQGMCERMEPGFARGECRI